MYVQGDDEDNQADNVLAAAAQDGPPADHIPIDFLSGMMPPVDTLHLSHHPLAPAAGVPVPFVARWNHDPVLAWQPDAAGSRQR